jgi:hypothetical protein
MTSNFSEARIWKRINPTVITRQGNMGDDSAGFYILWFVARPAGRCQSR